MNFRRTGAMARKELLHIIRDPRSLMAALTQPVMVLLLFGYALSLDVDRIPTIIYDADRSAESQKLVQEFRGSRYFQVVDEVDSYKPITERAMDQRRILVGVAIPVTIIAGAIFWPARRRLSRFYWTGPIRTRLRSPWATPKAWSNRTQGMPGKMLRVCAPAACLSFP